MSIPAVSGSLLADAHLFELSPEHIEIGDRVGFLHEDKAVALGRLMAVFGQRDAIKVIANKRNAAKPWKLVTGRHRLEGARIEGMTIHAIEVKGTPEALADMEASENLHRRPLGPIERAMFVQSLAQAAQQRMARELGDLKHHQLAAKARWDRVKVGEITAQAAVAEETDDAVDKMSSACGWREDAADALGLGKKELQRALTLYRLLIAPFPDLIEQLAKHPVVGENAKQLRDIADIKDEGARKSVIEALLADDELSADEAKVQCGIGLIGGAAATPVAYQKHYDAITGGWSRLGTAEKRKFLPSIASMLPTEMKRELRDMLTGEIGNEGDFKAALATAFGVIAKLSIGEGVDDDEIENARRECQNTLFADAGVDLREPADAR